MARRESRSPRAPWAEPLGFVDIAWILGFIVSGAVYLLLARMFPTTEPAEALEPVTTAVERH